MFCEALCLLQAYIIVHCFLMSICYFQRHNTIEHGGKLSRSKRNAALQVFIIALLILIFKKHNSCWICHLYLNFISCIGSQLALSFIDTNQFSISKK